MNMEISTLHIEYFVRTPCGELALSPHCEGQIRKLKDIQFHHFFDEKVKELLILAAVPSTLENREELTNLQPLQLLQKITDNLPENSPCQVVIHSLLIREKIFNPKHFSQELNYWVERSSYFQALNTSRGIQEENAEIQQFDGHVKMPHSGSSKSSSHEEKEELKDDQDQYIGRYDPETYTKQGLGVFYPCNSALKRVTGVWTYDEINGPAIFEFNNENIEFFMGETEKNEPLRGFMQLKNGARYYGSFKNGLPHGEGLYQSADRKNSYQGNFKEGKFNGVGELLDTQKKVSVRAEWENEKVKRVIDEQEEKKGKDNEKVRYLEMMREEEEMMFNSRTNSHTIEALIEEKIKKFKKKSKQEGVKSRDSKSKEQLMHLHELKLLVEAGLFKRGPRGKGDFF